MRSYPGRATTVATLLSAGLLALAACSSSGKEGPSSSSAPASPSTTTAGAQAPTPAPGAIEVSPGGVTTAVRAPSQSTEEEYFQACHAAKTWMDQQGGDRKALIEKYLADVQKPDAAPGPGTFGGRWAELSQERQSAVIVAAQAGADQLCG